MPKRVVKSFIRSVVTAKPFVDIIRRAQRKKIAIIMYHGVYLDPLPMPNWCQLPKKFFDDHLDLLRSEYKILPLFEVLEAIFRDLPLPDNTACITFDDATKNVYDYVIPTLIKFQIPATFNAVTGGLDTRHPSWADYLYSKFAFAKLNSIRLLDQEFNLSSIEARENSFDSVLQQLKEYPNDERIKFYEYLLNMLGHEPIQSKDPFSAMNWDELIDLNKNALFEVGGHTHTHPILSQCSEDTQYNEIKKCWDSLFERGIHPRIIAYPNGRLKDFTKETEKIVEKVGFSYALTTIPGFSSKNDGRYSIRRINVSNKTEVKDLQALLLGI